MEYINNNRLRFDKKYKFNEDAGFILSALGTTDRLYYMNEPFYKYFIRDNSSVMSSYRKDMFVTNVKTVELIGSYLRKYKYFDAKSKLYYKHLFDVMLDSLINEVTFAGKKEFLHTCSLIRNFYDFEKMYSCIKETNYFRHRIIATLIENRCFSTVYLLLKIRKVIKTEYPLKRFCWIILTKYYEKIYKRDMDIFPVVYMFHNISDKATNVNNYVSNVNEFEEFLVTELSHRKPFPISDFYRTGGKTFTITFDDGYEGVYLYAYPILKRLSIPFTVFVTTGFIDKDGYLKTDQLKTMSDDPLCTIGAHTMTHPLLRFCEDPDFEIRSSKELLENILNKKICFFAYPYGSIYACNRKSIMMAKAAGFECAFSAVEGALNVNALKHSFFLPRINGDPLVKKVSLEGRLREN